MPGRLHTVFPACTRYLPDGFWEGPVGSLRPGEVPDRLAALVATAGAPPFLPDLARVELARCRTRRRRAISTAAGCSRYRLNPGLILLQVGWQPLLSVPEENGSSLSKEPDILLFWRDPRSGRAHEAAAAAADLLALKLVAERLDPLTVARETGQPVGRIDAAIDAAVERGLLLAPPSRLQRRSPGFPAPEPVPDRYRVTEVFTLQWHITHRCDLHCRHCYDRSLRHDVDFARGVDVLDQLRAFCRTNHVRGQVSFSGGHPFLHPEFTGLYRAAHERNLTPAILGNPVSAAQLDEILEITRPAFYQVSLEGMPEHNDRIRGKGSFAAVMAFLELLRSRRIYSMVMLTLTRANLDQVLPLAELLRDRVDLFTFNRLAMVGEGASLVSPWQAEYRDFLGAYLAAREASPVIALKDSLINIELEARQQQLFGGCTGFGCGAAFNFVSLLPDGEVHACRKFPSPIGNIHRRPLGKIYHSAAAQAYRRGCRECACCRLRAVCGGCLAVAYGWGLDPLREKDPACFIDA